MKQNNIDYCIYSYDHIDGLDIVQSPIIIYLKDILGMTSANERRRYYVTPTLIGRAHTQNYPFILWPSIRILELTIIAFVWKLQFTLR